MPRTTRRKTCTIYFQREAFYGVGTVNDGGTAIVPISLQFQADQKAGKYPGAARYVFNPGVVHAGRPPR